MTIIPRTLKFRTQALEIEAVRFDGSNVEEVIEWVGSDLCEPCAAGSGDFIRSLLVTTPEGARRADTGDWIIKEDSASSIRSRRTCSKRGFNPPKNVRANSSHMNGSSRR